MAIESNTERPAVYRGVNTSLYLSLPEEAVQNVERAIWCKLTGQMDSGRAIFNTELYPFKNVPVVVIEHADLEIDAGRWGRAWQILDSSLTELRTAGANLDLPEHRLMALTRGMLGVRHRGDPHAAVLEIERAQHWLHNVPVEEYTDVQANCVRRYVIAYLLARLSANYQNSDVQSIPMWKEPEEPDKQTTEWAGLGHLRRSLTVRGMFNEANLLFRVEFNRVPLKDRAPIAEEFLSAIADLPSSRNRDFIEASIRLQWGTSYAVQGMISRTQEELMRSNAAFDDYCNEFNITDKEAVPHLQDWHYQSLLLIQDPEKQLACAESILDIFERTHASRTGMCLSVAAEAASSLFKSTGRQAYQDQYFDFHTRLERYDETESEDLCDLVVHRNDLIVRTIATLVDRRKSLEWIDGFLQRYPHFACPTELAALYRRRALLLKGLQRIDEANEADQSAEELETRGLSIGKWIHMPMFGGIGPTIKDTESTKEDSEEDDAQEPFYTTWRAATNLDKMKQTTAKLVIEWLFDDVNTYRLTADDFRKMTKNLEIPDVCSGGPKRVGDLQGSKSSQIERTTLLLFPTDAKSAELQDDFCNRICDWLSSPPKGHRGSRYFCLLMLREARQLQFSEQYCLDIRIRELRRLLELYPKLPREIRDNFSSYKGSWLAGIALTHVCYFNKLSDLHGQEAHERLLCAEKYNKLALSELRKHRNLGEVALNQRTGATICLLQIFKLRQLSEKESARTGRSLEEGGKDGINVSHGVINADLAAKQITKLRKLGLGRLEKAQKIFTSSELHASWSDGLQEVKNRQDLASFQASARTIHTTISLLLAMPGQASRKSVDDVWARVQGYKARSLARTIGVRSSGPPGLVSQIMASEKARPMYQEMLHLEKQIEKAELRERFNLRRQLDSLRVAMKQQTLLRRLIDLSEAAPLEASDIATIETQVGSPVVLVDWFYLQPFLADEAGKLLLLTARAGADPTMDILTTKMEDVIAWQTEFLLDEKKLLHEDARLIFDNKLRGLVSPLAQRTREGEVLVFCPSSALHRLPLHALSVPVPDPEEPGKFASRSMIHRNPIVYAHSHSLLRSCFSVSEHAWGSPAPIKPMFLSGIPEADALILDSNGDIQSDFTAGRESILGLAKWFDTKPMIDRSATKKKFMDAVTGSRLIHLHTHCNWNGEDPLNHHVEFPMLECSAEFENGKLTAREVFDIRVLPGTHVNMIACQGAVTEVKMGDEVMGLIPALLYSGASSTISTLWKVRDGDGVDFAFHFFESLVMQCMSQDPGNTETQGRVENTELAAATKKNGASFVDMAKALRYAAMEMDRHGNRPLYDWAGYVLHGFWQFPISSEDLGRLQKQQD